MSLGAHAQSELIKGINATLIPIKTLSPDSDFSDLQQLKSLLHGKKIIALGEATHGTHEFFIYKHRLAKFLITEMGFKTFVFEADFAGTQSMNDYVLHGKGDPRNALLNMSIDPWMVQEMVDMARWLKRYNSDKPDSDKVRFYGCDMQGILPVVNILRAYLKQTDQDNQKIEDGFTACMSLYHLKKEQKALITQALKALDHVKFEDTDSATNKLYQHDIVVLKQVINCVSARSVLFPAKWRDIRDKDMAENLDWIYNYTNNDRMIFWAHNEHIAKAKNNSGLNAMGIQLAEKYKDEYYAMGFGFNAGRIRAMNKDNKHEDFNLPDSAIAKSSDHIFANCQTPNFILDFKTASDNKYIYQFLHQPVYSYSIGADYVSRINTDPIRLYVEHKLADTYDAIIFIRNTSPSLPFTLKQ